MQSDIAEGLYRLTINSGSTCSNSDCVNYRDRVARDQRNILLALREQRFNMNTQPAPPTIELPRPHIPHDRPSKRRGGYLSTHPLLEDQDVSERPPPTFSHSSNMTSSSSSSHFTSSDNARSEPHFTSPAFTTPLNPPNRNQFSSFTSLFDDDALFSAEYNASTFEHGGSSNDAFVTPRHSIHLNESPWFDLNMSSSHPSDNVQHQQNDIEEQRRRRGTRCGTGSHYL